MHLNVRFGSVHLQVGAGEFGEGGREKVEEGLREKTICCVWGSLCLSFQVYLVGYGGNGGAARIAFDYL